MGDELDSEPLARVGTVLNDKWTLEGLLGVGGMAAVYSGRHRNGARAAIKMLHPDLARNKEVLERFRREGYAANKVEHPGVVKVLDDDVVSSGPYEGTAYLVMELLEGESLQDRLERRHAIGEREFLQIAEQVLGVLEAAHERGVVHRDLKPENLFFARQEGEGAGERIKVLDFGLARLLQAESITTYGLALGTPSFMSPEQAAGRTDEVDGRTDLYALAATGFRLRTGRRIHEADNPVKLVGMMGHLPAPKIREVAPDVSEPYARVIDRALEFKRDDRYENAAAMKADVARALAQLEAPRQERIEPVVAKPPPPVPARPQAPSAPPAPEPTIELSEGDIVRPPAYGLDESIRIPKRRSIVPWLVLIAVVGFGVWFWRDRGRAWLASQTDVPAPSASTAVDAGAVRPIPDGGAVRLRPLLCSDRARCRRSISDAGALEGAGHCHGIQVRFRVPSSGNIAHPMPTSLRSALDHLAQSFANGVLAAIRGASLDDLLTESGGPRRGPGRPRGTAPSGPRKKANGRLARRSPDDIAKTLDKVVSAVRATRGKGLRAEQIRKQLGLDVREVPRVLRVGLSAKKLRSKGQKRATTYFAA